MAINSSNNNERIANTSYQSNEMDGQLEEKHKNTLVFKISAIIFYLLAALLLLITIIKMYRQKNTTQNYDYMIVCEDTSIHIIISAMTWSALLIGGYLIAKLIKFLNQSNYSNHSNAMNGTSNQSFEITKADINGDSRRNSDVSQSMAHNSHKMRPSLTNGPTPWLTAVRNDAYETHRRLSSGNNDANIIISNN